MVKQLFPDLQTQPIENAPDLYNRKIDDTVCIEVIYKTIMFCKKQGYFSFKNSALKNYSQKKNVHDINCNWEAVKGCMWLFDK